MDLFVAQGSLLAAWPDLLDPNFIHSVVLMCQHSQEGAYGLVVNRLTDVTVGQLFPEDPLLSQVDFPVHLGGPVDRSTLQFVHSIPEHVPGAFELADGVHLGGDLHALGRFLREEPDAALRSVRVLLGYSGWGAGQLDDELAAGSWVPAPADGKAVFGGDAEQVWKRVVRSAKGPAGLEDQPPDPSWN